MKPSFLIISLILNASIFCTYAQDATKKKSSQALPAKVPSPEPAIVKPIAMAVSFQPARWTAEAPILSYLTNDPAKIFQWTNVQLSAIVGKPDQFSTSDERRVYQEAISQKLKDIGPLAIIHQCPKKYNSERQEFEIKIGGFAINDATLKDPNPEALSLRRVVIGRGETSRDTYSGQNAYGATTEITRTVSELFAITFPFDQNQDPSSVWVAASTNLRGPVPYRLNYGAYTFNIPMAPAEAREQDKSISCLAVITLSSPGTFKFTERIRPTRDMPFDNTTNFNAFTGTLDMLAIINNATGMVYAKAMRQGF